MSTKKATLILMGAFLAAGILAAILASRFWQDDDMLTREEADQMVEDAVQQAQVDIRQELDEQDIEPIPEEPEEEEEEEVEEEPEVDRQLYRYTVVRVHNDKPLYYRSGPSKKYRIMGKAPNGTTGYMIDYKKKDYSLCVVDGYVAYMYSGYLQVDEVDASEYPAEYLQLSAEDAGKKVKKALKEKGNAAAADDGDTAAAAEEEAPAATETTSTADEAGTESAESVDSGATEAADQPEGIEAVQVDQGTSEEETLSPEAESLQQQLEAGEITEEEMKEQYEQLEQ